MSDRKPTSAPWIIAVVLLVLLGGYVGAYYAMVRQKRVVTEIWQVGVPAVGIIEPGYTQSFLKRFFAPIHWLDRRIRPYVWNP